MNLKDAIDFEYPENEMAKPLKNITLSEADSTETFKFKPFEYERGAVTKTTKGVINTIRDMQDLPEQVKIFGKRISFGFGGYFGDNEEETERKKLNLITAERNLNEAQAERYKYTSGREAESIAYGVGGGIVNYGTMLIPAGLVGGGLKAAGATAKAVSVGAEAAGLGTMSVLELAGQVQDKTPEKEGEIDVEAMTPEWARKATGGTLAYTALSAVTEKYVGFGQQMKMWNKPIKWGGSVTSKALTTLRTTGINALSEGATEGIQDLEAAGIGLIDGTLTMDKLPARLQQAWKSAIIGGIIGGGVGTAAAMKSARNVKKQLRDMVAPVVGEQDANTVAEAIYNAGTDDMTKAISIELELSSELKNKHGKVWNSMLAAVSREIEGKPRFMAMSEDERASYANTVAKHFADQVLAEANYRGTTLDAILSASDITYDKGIRLERHINLFDALKNPEMIPPETKLKRESLLAFLKRKGGLKDYGGELKARDAQKLYPGLVSNKGMNFDDAALMAWQYGYFPSKMDRPDINEFLEAVDESLRGNHRYNVEEERTFTDALDDLEQELDRMDIDWRNMTAAEIEKAVDELPELQSLEREAAFYEQFEPEIGLSEDEAERLAIETEGKEYPVIDEKDLPERYYQEGDEYNPRETMPKVRGGWTKAKILRYLKEWPSRSGVSNATRMIAEFDSVEDFKNNMFYHGSKYGTSKGMKPSITMSDREVERIGGGGYGEKYWAISLSKSKKVAGTFATSNLEGRGNIYPVLLAKNANVIEMPELSDSADLDDYIEKLYNDGVDAVWIGDKDKGEQELAVINPRAIVNIGTSQFYKAYKLGQPENPINIKSDEEIQKIYDFAKEYVRKYPRHAPDEAVQEAKGIVYWQTSDENIYGATNSKEEPIAGPENFNIFIEGSRVTDNDEPVSPENPPKKIYRGDTRYFEEYEAQDNAYEYDWGKGFYLSDDYEDVAENYQSRGADLTNRIDREAEQLAQDEDIDYDEAREKIRKQYEQEDIIREFYLSIKEPVIIGGEKETFFDYTEETDEYGEPQGKLLDLIYGIENYLADIGADDYTQAITGNLYEQAIENGGLTASQVEDIVRGTEEANYLIDYESGPGEMLSSVFGSIGFDGIIDHRAGTKFKNMNMNPDTTHYIVFNSEQAKSVDNKGSWGVSNKNFYLQRGKNAKGYTNITPDAYIIKLLEGADESTLPHEFAHYWLTEMWNYVRSGRASENYMKRWNVISDYLGIKPEQTRLTRGQQEKFASSYEAYLTRGELPTPLIGSAFDDYDKWLQRVYSNYNRINYQSGYGKRRVRLTDAAIKFFQSMTTGTLEAPALAPKDTGVEVPQTVSAEEVIEPTNEIIETPTTYDTTRVINITEGEKGVSKVFQREAMKHADRIVDELGVSYNKINLEEQAIKAAEWVQNNLDEAREVVNGKAAPEGIIDTAIFIAYENEMLRIGNNAEYQRALKIHSQVQTQRGQAIAAERISTDDVYNPAYWWKKLQKNKETDVARKLFKGDTEALNKMIETETKSIMKQIAGKPKEEQVEALTKLAEKLQKDYKLDTLYQMPDDVNERTVREFIKDTIGVNPDVMAGNEVINKAEQLQKLWENTKDSSGNPSVEAMRAKRELNDLIQAQTPSNALAIWTSIFGRGVMLTSVKSPVLNIISNIEAGFTEGITRRLMYGATEKAVDKTVKEEFSKYAWEVYKASADIVTTMNDYDDDMRIIGEQILHSQGPGAFRAASRKVEEVSFKYLMGAPDAVAKTLAFNDTADLLATKIAKEEGAKDISKRATEIYKDAILIKPETEVGQKVREQAQAQAHYTTFTNDSWAARFGLSARNWLNMVGRNKIRLGDLTMKFVKTPANVQMMGLEYGFGSLYTLYNVQEIIKNPQSETSQIAIRAAVRNGLGIALAALLYSMLDPDDYFSEFDTLNPKEKDRMRAMGAMPNSIKIGNRWVSLDYFGQLGIPLVGMLEARRNNGLRSYIQSGLTQAAKIPGIKETKQLIDNMSEYARYDLKPEKIAQMMAGTVLDQARAMTIPAIVNDIAKMTDDYERDTMGNVMDKVISSIPGLRQTLPERYGIQGLVRTEPALSTLLFGSRVKTEQSDKLVREVEKLAGKAEQPSISDVTKYGDLRLLSPEKKVKVRKEFYKAYNAESKKLISTREYQKKSPEDKKKALNKVRNRVVKSLKEKYSNDIQREKRRQ